MTRRMTIAIASDHGGAELKEVIKNHLSELGCPFQDLGVAPDAGVSVDYPDYALKVVESIKNPDSPAVYGILICGTGIGMSMAANRFQGIRATLVWDHYTAKMSRAHNDSNVLCLGARVLEAELAKELVTLWLADEFEERHRIRLEKLDQIGP